MNAYATARDLAERYGVEDLADLLADDERLVTDELLVVAIYGTLTSDDWTDAEIAAANAAMKRVNDALEGTTRFINSYIAAVVRLPLTMMQINETPLRDCCTALTLCDLMDDDENYTERAEKSCAVWREWLEDIAKGRVVLFPDAGGGVIGSTKHGRTKSRYDWGAFGS